MALASDITRRSGSKNYYVRITVPRRFSSRNSTIRRICGHGAFDVFARDNPNSSTPETIAQSRTVLELFTQFVGKHFSASAISKKEVREWKAALRHYPVKATESREFRGKDFDKWSKQIESSVIP